MNKDYRLHTDANYIIGGMQPANRFTVTDFVVARNFLL